MATVTSGPAALDWDKLCEKAINQQVAVPQEFSDLGRVIPFEVTGDIPVGSVALNEVLELIVFPPNCRLLGLQGSITDVDTNGTPLHVFKLQIDATDVVTGITAGQAGGTLLTAAQVGSFLFYGDVSSKTLKMDTTTGAATAAAGTFTIFGALIRGLGISFTE